MAACARPFSRLSFVLALAASLPALSPALSPAWAGAALIYVTNSAGDSIHVIDPATPRAWPTASRPDHVVIAMTAAIPGISGAKSTVW